LTSPHTKRIDFVLSPKLQEHFNQVYIMGKTLILESKDYHNIVCKYDPNDLIKTTGKGLLLSLENSGFTNKKENMIVSTELQKILLEALKQQCDQAENEEKKEQEGRKATIDEIGKLREQNTNLTLEEWRKQLLEKLQTLKDTVNKTMPEIWPGLEFELSILKILDLEDCDLPFIGIILGRPSSYKTVIISLLKDWHNTFYTDIFTARSFVSHSTAVDSEEELQKIDLLPKIRNNLFLTPELSPLFTSKEDDLTQLLGIITRIADGHGLSSDSGAHGHRGYDGDYMLVWVGAAVDIPYKVYKVLGNLGAKMYFYRMKFEVQTQEQLIKYAVEDQNFKDKTLQVKNTLFDFLKWLEAGKGKIKEDDTPHDIEALKYIAGIADLLSFLRCVAKVWETYDTQGSEYAYSISQRENPFRAITHLKNLAKGRALLEGRNHITLEDIPLVIKTALDSAQIERVSIFSLLIAHNGKLSTDQIVDSLNVASKTALRTMAEFKAIGLVTVEDTNEDRPGRPSKLMILNPRFNWFLKDELITKIIPHSHIDSNSGILAATIAATGEVNNNGNWMVLLAIFWHVFDELQKEEAALNIAQEDKLTVNRQKFEQRLIGTGQFFNGDATRMITQMLKGAKLIEVMPDTLKKP
jgi:hypothetical protein